MGQILAAVRGDAFVGDDVGNRPALLLGERFGVVNLPTERGPLGLSSSRISGVYVRNLHFDGLFGVVLSYWYSQVCANIALPTHP